MRKPTIIPSSKVKRAGPGRPPSIDSGRLLAVARDVFLERGIGATTLEVAQRAGVSEGVLFHRFKSKEGLFSAAMNFDADEMPARLVDALRAIEALDVREGLVELSTRLLEIGRVALPIMMISWSNPQSFAEGVSDEQHAGFRAFLRELSAYFERRMDAGELRRMDAEVLARTLLGAVHHYGITRILLGPGDVVIPEGMYVRGLIDLLLNGAAPSRAAVPSREASFDRRLPQGKSPAIRRRR